MKRVLTIATVVMALAGCAKDPQTENTNSLVEIKVTSEVESTSKAPINPAEPDRYLPAGTPVAFVRATDAPTAVWNSTTAVGATAGATGSITFGTPQFYNADPTKKSHLLGYSPIGTWATDKVTWTNAIDGKTDLMYTAPDSKDKTTPVMSFSFKHALTWLVFNVIGDANSQTVWGNVTSVEVLNTKNSAVLTFVGQAVAFSGDATVASWNLKSDIAPIPVAIPAAGVGVVASGFSHTMVAPNATYKLLVKTVNKPAGTEVNITPKDNIAGKKYAVILTFSASTISATANVVAWIPGADVPAPVE